ncbi:MAG: aminotransferase class IV [Acidobacteria bacterium]|nr:aminotransferase class IV [Acidobacteriota bacterium]
MGLFETMLVRDGRVVQLEEHLARMAASCRALEWGELDAHRFRSVARGAAMQSDESAVRVTRTTDGEGGWLLEATAFAIPQATRLRRTHGRAITLDPSFVRPLPQHKTLPLSTYSGALAVAIQAGADEAFFVTPRGEILEGSGTNVFAMRGDTLTTAPGVLPGVVRAWVLSIARQMSLRIEERAPRADELRMGGFVTGSLTTLAPLRFLDGHPCASPGEAYEAIARQYPPGE